MLRTLTLPFVAALLCGCSAETPEPADGASRPPPAVVDPYDDSDCNLETVLDPEKPGAPGHLIESPRNPNGDSELAVLMRRMVEQLKENRLLVKNGESAQKMWPTHRTMRCAWPTNPNERNEGYDGRSQSYLATVRAFDEAPSQESYNAVVQGCIACHQINCGGVIGFLETLRWD